jgi:predicted NBD/HSP70 family sugar kinase
MSCWKATIRVGSREAKLLVTDKEGDELMRARLPSHPDHPRALLTLLEALALWSGSPSVAAISVAASA